MTLRKLFLLTLMAVCFLFFCLLAFMASSFVQESFRDREVLGRLVADRVYGNLVGQTARVQRRFSQLLETDLELFGPQVYVLALLDGDYCGYSYRGEIPVGAYLGDITLLWEPHLFLGVEEQFLLVRRLTVDDRNYVLGILPDFGGTLPPDLIGEGYGLVLCNSQGQILWQDGESPFADRGHVPRVFLSSVPGWHIAPWGEPVWGRSFSLPIGGLRLFVSYPLQMLLPGIARALFWPGVLAVSVLILFLVVWHFLRRQFLDPVERTRGAALSVIRELDEDEKADMARQVSDLGESMAVLSRRSGLRELRDFGQAFSRSLQTIAHKEEELSFYAGAMKSMNDALEETNRDILRRDFTWKQTLETSQAISRDGAQEGLLEHLCDIVMDCTDAFGIALGQVAEDHVEPLLFRGFGGAAHAPFPVPLESSLIGRAIHEGAPLWVADPGDLPGYHPLSPSVVSEVNIPLFYMGRVVGGMTICWDVRLEEDQGLMETILPLAAYVAGTVDAERSKGELRASYHYLVNRLQHLTAIYHEETSSHLSRTESYCRFLAQELGRSPEEVEDIGFFSRLHDIGKLNVPRDILVKSGPLTTDEFEVIKRHSVLGADILGEAAWLDMGRRICLYHHEKWDGSGYPEGLSGESIPWEARVMALADVYDAVRSPRCYKEGRSHEDTVRVILEGDGRVMPEHFDPLLLDIFREKHREMARIYEQFAEVFSTGSSGEAVPATETT